VKEQKDETKKNKTLRDMSRSGLSFLVDTLLRQFIYSGQMVCGALRRTVLQLHQSLRRGGWVPEHVSTDLALANTLWKSQGSPSLGLVATGKLLCADLHEVGYM
jgi:hypothetical protein